MTGMNRGVRVDNPIIVAAFHSSLSHQLLVIFVVVVLLALAWNVVRAVQFRRAQALELAPSTRVAVAEPRARLVLRMLFGALWVLDGLLQLQPAMPIGLPGGVLSPAASGAPSWVHRVVDFGVTLWSNHPITAATSAVWIQLGIGIALVVAPRGTWSRCAGLVAGGWGLVVWIFGEALGGLFTPGASWLFGLPGAAIFYVVAGLLLTLPEVAWRSPALGRRLLRGLGALFVAMGVLQAWPGRGTWEGQPTAHSTPGALTSMVQQMAQVSQPSPFASAVRSFASFDARHGWGVNLFVVVALIGVGACLLTGRRRIVRVGVVAGVIVCLANWVLVQDFGFFGGVGTDPNSMLPTSFLLVVGYLAMVAPATETAIAEPSPVPAVSRRWLETATPGYLLQVAAALCAAAIVLVGAAPMAVASANPHADAILTEAANGTPVHLDIPSWDFSLVDQNGRRVALSHLKGRVVVLTFLDPVCVTDCPLIAQQLRSADLQLGLRSRVVFVAIDANQAFLGRGALLAFDRQEQLTTLPNWEYLTGSLPDLTSVWTHYGAGVLSSSAGAMAGHSDLLYVIGSNGRIRTVIQSDPGNSAALASSLGTLVVAEVQRVLAL